MTQKADKAHNDPDGNPAQANMPNRDEIDQINANRVGTAGTVVTQGFHFTPQNKMMDRMANDNLAQQLGREVARNLVLLKSKIETDHLSEV